MSQHPSGAARAGSTPCSHPHRGELVTVTPVPLFPAPPATRRQAAAEASGTPLIDCEILLPATHLALVINWGFLPDLRHDSIPPKDQVFSAGILPLEPALHTGFSGPKTGLPLRELPPGASPRHAPRWHRVRLCSVGGAGAGVTLGLNSSVSRAQPHQLPSVLTAKALGMTLSTRGSNSPSSVHGGRGVKRARREGKGASAF